MSYFLGKVFNSELYNVSDDPTVNNSSYLASSVAVSIVNSKLDALRKTLIGCPIFWRSTKLPDNYCWANGDFVEFADWPELKEVYDAGGFEGMLMAWNADAGTQAANLGKWRPDAANPSGLFTPNLSGQFFRNWAPGIDEGAGQWHRDEIRNITGTVDTGTGIFDATGAFSVVESGKEQTSAGSYNSDFKFDASFVVPTGPQNVPPHVWQPVILYLGRPA